MEKYLILLLLFIIFINLIIQFYFNFKKEQDNSNIIYLKKLPLKKNLRKIVSQTNIKYKSYKLVKNIMFYEIYQIEPTIWKDYNIEHIVPQSVYQKDPIVKKDMHNLILYPKCLNSHRSNYKYVSDPKIYDESIILNKKGDKVNFIKPLQKNNSIKNNKMRIFHPNEQYKGQIARACMYFIHVYNWSDIIFRHVIDPYTILLWHHQYPVSDFENKKNKIILSYQGNENKYVSNPKRLVSDMESLLNTKLNSFKQYIYS